MIYRAIEKIVDFYTTQLPEGFLQFFLMAIIFAVAITGLFMGFVVYIEQYEKMEGTKQ